MHQRFQETRPRLEKLPHSRIMRRENTSSRIFGSLGLALSLVLGVAAQSDAEPAHFHHVHLNVTEPNETIQFYEKFFGASQIRFRNRIEALYTEKSFILLNQVVSPPHTHLETCLWHIGWAGVDGPSEYEWRQREGAQIHTPITQLGKDHFMYFLGPDNEAVEVYTGNRNHRFEHVHLMASDVNKTTKWFADFLHLQPNKKNVPRPTTDIDPNSLRGIWMNSIQIDNVNLVIFGRPRQGTTPFWAPTELGQDFKPTQGSSIDHIAFSFRSLEPEFERFKNKGATIQGEITFDETTGLKHFFVVAPDKLLIEIVEARPIPEGLWE